MSQVTSLTVPNAVALSVRQGLNDLCGAINSQHSGTTAPGAYVPWQYWADTDSGTLKIRNAENDAWISPLDVMAPPGRDLAMGGHKMTGLADGEDDTDAVTVGQLTAALDASALPQATWNAGVQHDRGDAHARAAGCCAAFRWLGPWLPGRVPPSPR